MNTETVTDLPERGNLQRVWPWRWQCPQAQTVFTIDYPELERVYQEQRAELREELDADNDLRVPRPVLSTNYPGLGQRGGNYEREQPQLTLLFDCAPPNQTRLDLETGFDHASTGGLLEQLSWAWAHTGRPTGLSPTDYAAQKEWTICRAITWSFFEGLQEMPGSPTRWIELFAFAGPAVGKAAAQVLGILLLARRIGRNGFTLDAPELAAVLKTSEATVWRALRLLERAGYLIRMHRFKPGRNGRPVALTANWYGFGPKALEDLRRERPADAPVRRARLLLRRQHLRAEARRRTDLLPGYEYPDTEGFLALTMAAYGAARARDQRRWVAFCAGEAPTDFTTASLPSFAFELGEEPHEEPQHAEPDPEPVAPEPAARAPHAPRQSRRPPRAGDPRRPRPSAPASPRDRLHAPPKDEDEEALRRLTDLGTLGSAPRAPEIPKSGWNGPPGVIKMNYRTGPQASGPPPRQPSPEPRPPPDPVPRASDRADSTAETDSFAVALAGIADPVLRAVIRRAGGAAGF